jgi:2-amino-4-hydroxy-6-hydroxymethyldihydropteridine diphosphokinase
MDGPVRQALLGAGANLGPREAALKAAVDRLQARPEISFLTASPVYETEPVGLTSQPRFLNLVIGLETTLTPEALLALIQQLEHDAGRTRDIRWGPRTLDLDLLAYEGESRATAALQLPHPRMLERTFVTVPLRDILSLPRFQRPCWVALKKQLDALPPSAAGVRRAG